ncbi:MAG TPA: hypothetical protein VFC75_00665 [Erysipelothrix sp.]|nr:hypothetical protein [Erysipelothrix sp.]
MKQKILSTFMSFMLLFSVGALNNYLVSDEGLKSEDMQSINNRLNEFATDDFELYIDINESNNYEFSLIDSEKPHMLLSINLTDNSWEFQSTRNAQLAYTKKDQKNFMESSLKTLQDYNFVKLVDDLTHDIEHKLSLPTPEKELFSIKRFAFAFVIALLIALIMAQATKNKLKTFRAKRTAISYIESFEITQQKDTLRNVKKSEEYINNTDRKGSSGKF